MIKKFHEFHRINENRELENIANDINATPLEDIDEFNHIPNGKKIEGMYKDKKYTYLLNRFYHGENEGWENIKKQLKRAGIKFVEIKDKYDGDDQIVF